jgi:hypothetical protein
VIADTLTAETTTSFPGAGAAGSVSLPKVFALFALLYLSTWGGHYTSGDGAVKLAWTRAILDTGSADIDPGPGVAYSKYGIGHSLLAVLPIGGARVIEAATGIACEPLLYTLLFVVNGAAFLVLVAAYLRRHFEAPAVWGALLVIGLCTTWWPYTKLDFSEPLVTSCLFAGFLLVRSDRPVAGVAIASLSGLIRPDAFLAAGVILVWTALRGSGAPASPIRVGAALAVPLALHGLSNLWRYGAFIAAGYDSEAFSTPILAGLWGLLLSPGKAIALYSPPLVAALAGVRRFAARSDALRHDARLFMSLLAAHLLLYSAWWDWSGDDAWGSRLVIPGVMFACVLVAASMDRRWLIGSVAALGLVVQAGAVLVSPLDYALMVRSGTAMRQSLYFNEQARLDFEDVRFQPRYSPIAGHLRLVAAALGAVPHQTDRLEARRSGTSLTDAFPPDQWMRYGRWDPLWMRAVSCAASPRRVSMRECIRAR